MSDTMGRNRELVLPPGTYAYVLDSTKGKVSAYVGPFKNSLSDTDQLVKWDARGKRYTPATDIESAKQTWALAGEGQYIILTNPAPAGAANYPPRGTATESVDLEAGKRVIVPGPITFPLWPGQTAETLDGHHLRHNQYVLVRVYDETQARANFESAIMAPQTGGDEVTPPVVVDGSGIDASGFTMGQLIIVPGTRVSFYMPSTGLEVVPEGTVYVRVRDAVTLETLEYCVLLDENGQKRYVQGPAVVFPKPTESFRSNTAGGRNFQAIELDERSGLYVKVIEAYTENNVEYPAGKELFITGAEQAIYFPRPEHSIITYGDQRKHHAIAIPAGEGRYVLDRGTGQVDLVRGPLMFLPDPRTQVVVRRILDPHDVALMYPGNEEALAVNARYQEESEQFVEEEDDDEGETSGLLRSRRALYASAQAVGPMISAAATMDFAAIENFGGDAMSRRTSYTPSRTITLDTKYEGAVAINIWPGYAVLVTNKTGERRVEQGPQTVLLEYDETIMALELSTGRPKNDTNLLRTGYLRVLNNVVSDRIFVETRDLVRVDIGVSYRVNFIGEDPVEWFALENYVQALTDHCRSRLRNAAKQYDIREFYMNTINIVRDTLLGETTTTGRTGLSFDENGMHVYDVEVLKVDIDNEDVEDLLLQAQSKALSGAIELSIAEDTALRQARLEALRRSTILELQTTAATEAGVQLERLAASTAQQTAVETSNLTIATERAKVVQTELEMAQARFDQEIATMRAQNEVDGALLQAQTSEFIRRMEALQPGLIEAMTTFGNQALVEKVVTAVAPAALAAGVTTADILSNMFQGTPLEAAMKTLAGRPLAAVTQGGDGG